jgi:cell division septal protein FtsQ
VPCSLLSFVRGAVCKVLVKIYMLVCGLKIFFVISIIRIFTMKIEKFQLRGNISVCASAFQLLCGCASAQHWLSSCQQLCGLLFWK